MNTRSRRFCVHVWTLITLTLAVVTGCYRVAPGSSVSADSPLAVTHVTVIDMTGAGPRDDMTVLVVGNRIAALGPSAVTAVASNARVIDGRGKYLIPGLWDMHTHLISGGGRSLPLYIANGETGVRDMGGNLDSIKAWRREISTGHITGPTIVAAGPIVDGPTPGWPLRVTAHDTAEGRRIVDSLKREGVDFIKVHQQLARDVYFSIAAEARRVGIPFAGHVPSAVTPAEASDAGQHSIEHLIGLPDPCDAPSASALPSRSCSDSARALMRKFVTNGTWHVPTLIFWQVFFVTAETQAAAPDTLFRYISGAERAAWAEQLLQWPKLAADLKQRLFANDLRWVNDLNQAGVRLMAGTDVFGPYQVPGFALHRELELLVRAGLSPMQALQSATINPAEYLQLADWMGTVAIGKRADLVLLDANPLEDIRNSSKIRAVILGGRLIDSAQRTRLLERAAASALHN